MPDLGKGKYVNGKLYCWDKSLKRFVEVQITVVGLAESEEIIAAFIEDGGDNCGQMDNKE